MKEEYATSFMAYLYNLGFTSKFQRNEVGIFMTKVPFFGHRTQGFCLCYLQNTQPTWNKFKCEDLGNSNYDSSYGGGCNYA